MDSETWEQDTDQAWGELQGRLGAWLGDEPGDKTVVIELAWPEDERSGAAPYAQLCIEDGGVHAEAVSNHYLDERFRLDKPRRKVLRGLGWQRPTDDVRNYWCEREVPDDAEELAGLLVQTLREVYGVPAPSFLAVSGFGPEGRLEAADLPLGLSLVEVEEPAIDTTAVVAADPDELRDLVAAAVESTVGYAVAFDADGDIPVPAGNTVVYVRVEEESPSVRLFTSLLRDVRWTPRVGHALNEVNSCIGYGRAAFHDGHVVVEYQMFCRPFVPELMRHAVVGMTELADGLDVQLQQRIGGSILSDHQDGVA